MATPQQSEAIKGAKVLMVGAGGIGCELLKTLALSGFSDVHVIDMDTIEVSNLNRQFLFRQSHVGQSKAKVGVSAYLFDRSGRRTLRRRIFTDVAFIQVARDSVLRFRPNMSITPYHANVKDPDFNVEFFKQFNVVLNGLDNLDARRHVNRLCLAADVPLVESGTTGFLGQVTVHVKGKTECYECRPKPAPKTYPVCTITSTPSKFVHCIVWAKDLLFAKLFGDKTQENDLNVRSGGAASSSEQPEDVFEHMIGEDVHEYGRRVYDHVFGYNIELALSNEETWKNRQRPRPIYSKDVLPDKPAKQNGNCGLSNSSDDPSSLSAMGSLGMKNPQEVWSLSENSRIFLEALKLFFEKRVKDLGNLIFDKDDQLAVEFVAGAANIRASSFGIPLHSLFEAKGVAGNIVHAVATTNAIIAGLIVIEAIKLLQNDAKNYRMTYCLEHPSRKMLLMPVEPFEPDKSCYVCSETPLSLEINTKKSTLRDFVDKIVKAKVGMNLPLIMNGSALLYEVGDDLDEDMVANYAANLEKALCELPAPVTNGTIVMVEDLQQELSCNINVKHRELFDEEAGLDGMLLLGWNQVPPSEKDNHGAVNGVSASMEQPSKQVVVDDDEMEISDVIPTNKRKLQDALTESSSKNKKVNDKDENDGVVMLESNNPDVGKKRKLMT